MRISETSEDGVLIDLDVCLEGEHGEVARCAEDEIHPEVTCDDVNTKFVELEATITGLREELAEKYFITIAELQQKVSDAEWVVREQYGEPPDWAAIHARREAGK